MPQDHSPRRSTPRVLTLAFVAGLTALGACASRLPEPVHVLHEPISYNTLARSPVLRAPPPPTHAPARPAYAAAQPTYSPPPRFVPSAQPVARPTQPVAQAVSHPVTMPVVSSRPAPQPTARPTSQPTTVAVATRTVSAPVAPVVSRSAVVSAPRVTGTLDDAALLPQFEAYESWVADETISFNTERRLLQSLISAHYRYEGDPSPANREKIAEKAQELRDVARIARSIDENSPRSAVETAEREVSTQAQRLTDRRRDTMRVIIAIQGYRQGASGQTKAGLLEALERFTAR